MKCYTELGQQIKKDFRAWERKALEVQINRPDLVDGYCHDLVAYSRLNELEDVVLGKVASIATARYLASLGGKGARSNAGDSVTPLFTVALYRLADEFGDDAVFLCHKEDGQSIPFRGVANRWDIKARFVAIMDEYLFKILVEIAKQ